MTQVFKNNFSIIILGLIFFIAVFIILNSFIDNETLLSIIEISVSFTAFIFGIIYNDQTNKRNFIAIKKSEYDNISRAITNIQTKLDIRNKHLRFIQSLNPEMDFNNLLKDVSETIESINNVNIEYNAISPKIKSSITKERFEEIVIVLTTSFCQVLEDFQSIISKYGDNIAKSNQAKTATNMLDTDMNKLHYVMLSNAQILELENQKNKFLTLYQNKKSQYDNLISSLNSASQLLLDEEYADIENLENELWIK